MTKIIGTFHYLCELALQTQSASLLDGSWLNCSLADQLVAIW